MPTYLYSCPSCGEFEYEHSIKDELEYCPLCSKPDPAAPDVHKMPCKVKRLIAKGGGFILIGGGWAADNYK
jgi:putative FmdB family regulatory protein